VAHLFADGYADDHGLVDRESYDEFHPVGILDADGDVECEPDAEPDGLEFGHRHGLSHDEPDSEHDDNLDGLEYAVVDLYDEYHDYDHALLWRYRDGYKDAV
jgi:hypothetical protein